MMSFAPGRKISPAEAMWLAIKEGDRGAGFVSPNPLVGCVLVDRDHRLLAFGFHRRFGFDHAEIDALSKIADPSTLKGGHAYVTLEPCAHQGRTPSCAKTLAPLKLASVTYAVEDPNPLVAGKGAAILREAGTRVSRLDERVDVSEFDRAKLINAAEDLAEIFLHNMRAKEPFVSVKIASTLDGKMALSSGESKWITGEMAREHVHILRARYDAVAIGRNTFAADNPSLNVRHFLYPVFKNKVVIFDSGGRTLSALAQSNLLKVRSPESVFVMVGEGVQTGHSSGVRVVPVPLGDNNEFKISELLRALKSEGFNSIMVEGGARTLGYFFSHRKVQRIHLFQSPTLLGGRFGLAWSQHFGVDQMANRIQLDRVHQETFGTDLYLTGRVKY